MSSLDSYSCPFLGFPEKISFETVFPAFRAFSLRARNACQRYAMTYDMGNTAFENKKKTGGIS